MAESDSETEGITTRSRSKVTDNINSNDQSDSKEDTQSSQSKGKRKRKRNMSQSSSGEPAAKKHSSQEEGIQPRVAISTLSNTLSKALNRVGVNQWTRTKLYEQSMLACIQSEFEFICENGIYYKHQYLQTFGSMIEGTTIPGMESDNDMITIMLNDVIEKESKHKELTNKDTVVVVADMFTPPGYVKIKAIDKDCSIFEYLHQKDIDDTFFVSNDFTDKCENVPRANMQERQTQFKRNGPALTSLSPPTQPGDYIAAFHCKSGLSFTKEFFHRTRKYGWPSQATIDIMKGQGCLLVPKGHSHCESKYQSLQWRISFSFQERHLMINLNSAQYKCYTLLKLIKKSHISLIVDLTSYHCKTALFYTIENTACKIWNEDNLLSCFILCLKRLRRWARGHFCPNFFIPEQNLFTGKIQEQDMSKLIDILSSLIKKPLDFLLQISIGSFGKLVQLYSIKSSDVETIELEIDGNGIFTQLRFMCDTTICLFRIRNAILHRISCTCGDINEIIISHYNWLKTIHVFKETNKLGPFPLDDVDWALKHVCRFLHSSLASHLTIKATETGNTVMKSWYSVTAAYHFRIGLDSDTTSGKLKLATLFVVYRKSKYEIISVQLSAYKCHRVTVFTVLLQTHLA